MADRDDSVAERVIEMVRDGTIPQPHCVNCGASHSKHRSLYAVLTRANRRWESDGSEGFVVGVIGWIPFILPAGSQGVEVREGEDLVVPLPAHICETCWSRLEGGMTHTALSMVSQVLCVAGIIAIGIWFFTEFNGNGISIFWILSCFLLALPFYFAAEAIKSRWNQRLTEYLGKVPAYQDLLTAYPRTQVLTKEPTALTSGAP